MSFLKKKGKKKASRATSNVFAMFEQSQIQEFKEVRIDKLRTVKIPYFYFYDNCIRNPFFRNI
jgi:hypothetical protein